MITEQALMHHIMFALSDRGHTVFRANVGQGWQGRIINKTPDTITLADYRVLQTGLPRGFSDLFGFTRDEHRPFFCEVKSETGSVSVDQRQFLVAMAQRGALAQDCRSVQEALSLIGRV